MVRVPYVALDHTGRSRDERVLVKALGQFLAVVAWVLTVVLVAAKYGLLWAALNFFIPPLSLIGSLFVFVWPLYLVALPLYLVGERRIERRDQREFTAAMNSVNAALAEAVVRVPMNGVVFVGTEYAGPGTLHGFDDGSYIIECERTGTRLKLTAGNIRQWGSGRFAVDGPADVSKQIVIEPNVIGAPNIQVSPPDASLIVAWLQRYAPGAAAT